ncbi:carboxyl transferase domain-containing protein [Mesorhizobium sp. WSM4887]|uniref:carboxyl transferase domain-containing protein n=1 Tax=Mesorhizobium sp. WSM4887 TaxID=3038543 RepID=UPI002415BD96|nr:carboxyl transferase domain-containing protein [Mesorhizobium sp. WSM4887]MDG4889796.1 carboxyl transferase domain-containing protein [Mesorhizobium sp. WSM4887]
MTSAKMPGDAAICARDYLDFIFDGSGWECFSESFWHVLARGSIGGGEVLALTLDGTRSPVPGQSLHTVARELRRNDSAPLILILTPCEISNDADQFLALGQLLAALALRRTHGPTVAVVLGPLIGPLAILAQLADINCLGPRGSLALADLATTKRVSVQGEASVSVGDLSCTFGTDAAALLGLRRIAGLLQKGSALRIELDTLDRDEDIAFERLAGADTTQHVDERRLLRRISDEREFVEFDSSGGLMACLAKIGGQTVGVLASTGTMSGVLDAAALGRASKLVDFCGRQKMPVVTLVDCPGLVPDDATLGAFANLVSTWADSGVRVVSLVVRKAIGAAAAALMPPSNEQVLFWEGARAGLLKDATGTPYGQVVAGRETRRALVATLASFREISV